MFIISEVRAIVTKEFVISVFSDSVPIFCGIGINFILEWEVLGFFSNGVCQ